MKEKRRDNKGRILHTGESQRTDGKYLYKYVDAFGNTKYVYAWRLTPTDPTPKGKREKPSLRELEQQIRRDIEDGIDSTGKKMTLCQLYLAGCIANALMEKEVPVYMTNFAVILGDLSPGFTGRNEYISRLCRYPLLIIDDFGMERGTDYGLEQVFHVIDTRYRSNKPLIATTNRPLDELKKPTDTAHSRIYDRLLSMCVPIRFTGVNFRQETAKRKMETMKKLLAE